MTIDAVSLSLPPLPRTRVEPSGGAPGSSAAPALPVTGSEPVAAFSDLLNDAISSVVHQLRKAETVSIAGLKGGAATHEVVQQVMMAEQSLQASIAVRDKIVAAYLEISRMQI